MLLSDQELEALLRDLESYRVERKESLSGDAPTKAREAICAFANDLAGSGLPGVLFIGARDDGTGSELEITDDLLLRLCDMQSDGNIVPPPSLVADKRVLNGHTYAVVVVEPSLTLPVRYKGRVCVRRGPRRGYATPEEETRLAERGRSRQLPFELRPSVGATLLDLDLESFRTDYLPVAVDREVLRANSRSEGDQLAALRFATVTGQPTNLGVLAFAYDPPAHIPGAYLQFVRVAGPDWDAPILDQKELRGPVSQLLTELDDVLRAQVSVRTDITSGPVETRRPDYPIVALQQLTRNAVMHRTYEGTNAPTRVNWFSDRIEIHSPGGPFGQVTALNFGQGVTDYRNLALAAVMRDLGYVQRFGAGIALARKAMADNGSPEPEFQVEETRVLAILRGAP